ncbi:DUF4145 domain-containing protein [Arthrobacter sp. TmT3-37]
MATTKCGWCGVDTHMTPQGSAWRSGREEMRSSPALGFFRVELVQTVMVCDQCNRLSIASVFSRDLSEFNYTEQYWRDHEADSWTPAWVEGQEPHDVPEHIAKAASEAHRGASGGNHMSAILMARTVIEATAKDKSITTGTLAKKIELMLGAQLVRPHVKEAADEVRHFGNDMAHGDIGIPVERDDAVEVLALMDEILNEVYQGPARTAALRERRLARQEQA